jgi:hypothetical protein
MTKRRGHGEGGIYQRESDGKWCASVDLGFVNGKRRRKVVYGKTRKEVADKLKCRTSRHPVSRLAAYCCHLPDRTWGTSTHGHGHPRP